MLRLSLPLGRVMGVEVRVHLSFVLLLFVAVAVSSAVFNSAARGFGLWFALLLAVVVREVARAIAAAYAGLRLRALFLLPVGGVMAFHTRRGQPSVEDTARPVTFAGPFANFVLGALMMASCYAFQPGVQLFEQPWVGFTHLLRAFVWMQFVIGLVGLLPSGLPGKPLAVKASSEPSLTEGRRLPITFNVGSILALGLVLAGILLMNAWIVGIGAFVFLGSQLSPTQRAMQTPANAADSIQVRDVMLTEYTLLSTSDTLVSALDRTVHSLQDVFPVVRGDRLVGSIARQTLLENLQSGGEAYLQGVMTRTLQTAGPDEPLVEALRRSAALGASELIPVIEEGAMLGVLTPQSLSRSVQVVRTNRPERGQAE